MPLNYPDKNICTVLKPHKNSYVFFSNFQIPSFSVYKDCTLKCLPMVNPLNFSCLASASIVSENCWQNVSNARVQLCVVSAESFVVATSRKVATLIWSPAANSSWMRWTRVMHRVRSSWGRNWAVTPALRYAPLHPPLDEYFVSLNDALEPIWRAPNWFRTL